VRFTISISCDGGASGHAEEVCVERVPWSLLGIAVFRLLLSLVVRRRAAGAREPCDLKDICWQDLNMVVQFARPHDRVGLDG
jgi:hypothetical protein